MRPSKAAEMNPKSVSFLIALEMVGRLTPYSSWMVSFDL